MKKLRLAGAGLTAMLMLMLGACSRQPDAAAEDAWLANVQSHYDNLDTETKALPASRGRARRSGNDLVLTLENGKNLTLHNDTAGCSDGAEHCDGYKLVADLPARHFFLVAEVFYEGADYWLIDDQTGRKTKIDALPIFSPDGSRFLVQNDNVADDHDNNLEIWRRAGDSAVIEWAHPWPQTDAEYPELGNLYHTEMTGWQGDRIALTFSTTAWFDTKRKATVPAQNWTGTLTHEDGGWRLQANWPKAEEN